MKYLNIKIPFTAEERNRLAVQCGPGRPTKITGWIRAAVLAYLEAQEDAEKSKGTE